MTAPTQPEPPSGKSSRTGTIVAIVAAVIIIAAGAVAWWLTTKDDEAAPSPTPTPSVSPSVTPSPSPSVTPSPSASPSLSPSASAASMEDMNGRWCSTSPDDPPNTCLTVTLPYIVWDGKEDQPEVVYPPDADVTADPSTYDYSVPANAGGCWIGGIDLWPATSGAPLGYCPAGADGGSDGFNDWSGMAGPVDEDRLWPGFQEPLDPPYVRADG